MPSLHKKCGLPTSTHPRICSAVVLPGIRTGEKVFPIETLLPIFLTRRRGTSAVSRQKTGPGGSPREEPATAKHHKFQVIKPRQSAMGLRIVPGGRSYRHSIITKSADERGGTSPFNLLPIPADGQPAGAENRHNTIRFGCSAIGVSSFSKAVILLPRCRNLVGVSYTNPRSTWVWNDNRIGCTRSNDADPPVDPSFSAVKRLELPSSDSKRPIFAIRQGFSSASLW